MSSSEWSSDVCSSDLFAARCAVLGRDDLASDSRYRVNRDRVLNRDTLLPELERALATQSSAYWTEKIRAAGIPAGLVRTVPDALDAPEIAARGLIVDTDRKSTRLNSSH